MEGGAPVKKLLVMDRYGAALDFVLRAREHGWDVSWYYKETPRNSKIGAGLHPPLKSLEHALARLDDHVVWLADNTMWMKELDRAPHRIGPTLESAKLELDRQDGQAFLQEWGVKTLPSEEFTSYDKAIAHVEKHPVRYVSKPCGDADKALTYVSKSASDMVYMLERWKKAKKKVGLFILQPFVKGIEMAIGGFLTPGGFRGPWHENFEFKKLMNGEKGVNTGEMGTVWHTTHRSKLAQKILAPLEKGLMKLGHTGYVDVNCIIDEKGRPWPLEFTMRPGWPSVNIQLGLLGKRDPVRAWETGAFPEGTCTGVVVAIPDFPYSSYTAKEVNGVPLYHIDPLSDRHHLLECQLEEKVPSMENGKVVRAPQITSAGDYLFVGTGRGATVEVSRKKAYAAVEEVEIPSSPMYRTDIGERLGRQLSRLHAMGYSTTLHYGKPSLERG